MNKLKNTLLAIVFVIPTLLLATSCGDDDEVTPWTDAEKTEFLEECNGGNIGGGEEVCLCALDKISSTYSYNDYQKIIEEEDLNGSLKILEYYSDCQEEL